MKIDEGCINHNVVRMIDRGVGNPAEYAYTETAVAEKEQMFSLGYVRGVLDLANELKRVLKE